ncbi:SWEET sugar transporter [Dillenia turbinata]|uniref:Bidirectional sugar transporter SWEET n=1 Tax=Dillenia turbinata TaxID=194707 RepID=A0AAN8VN65_9MAGN
MTFSHALTLTVGITGTHFACFLPTFYQIYVKKSSEGYESLPYIVALFSAMLWLYYGMLKSFDNTIVIINSVGCVIETFYITLYIIFASRNARILTLKLLSFLNLGLFTLIIIIIQLLVKHSKSLEALGWICAIFSVSVFAAPLSIMFKVIRTKSIKFMPFTLSFFLTLCAIAWLFYGLLVNDWYIAVPNMLGLIFGVAQMLLYGIIKYCYNETAKKEQEGPNPEHIINVGRLSTMGNCEVHPADGEDANEVELPKHPI